MKRFSLVLFAAIVAVALLAVPALASVYGGTTIPGPGSDPGPVSSSPQAVWHLDEASGTTAHDSSGHGFDGTVEGAAWVAAGVSGAALSFDGQDDYVQLPASDQLLDGSAFTVNAWFKTDYNHPAYGGQEGRLVNLHRLNANGSSSSALALYLEKDNIGLLYYNGSRHIWVKYAVDYADDEWHAIAVSFDGATFCLYYDGEEVAAKDDTFGGFGSLDARMGTYIADGRFYQGLLDEVGIWSQALSAAQIAELASPYKAMSQFAVKNADISFAGYGGDVIYVKGELELDENHGNGVDIADAVTFTIGTVTDTIRMETQGHGNRIDKWTYERPYNGDGEISSMTIDWKTGSFTVRMDRADLSGMIGPEGVPVSLLVGDDLGATSLDMKEKKRWSY